MLPEPYVLEYAHGLQLNEFFSWESFVQLGDTLLEQLLLRVSAVEVIPFLDDKSIGIRSYWHQFRSRPIIFISHGFGGIMLKRVCGEAEPATFQS